MLLSLDGTFLVQILNFVVFWILLRYLFILPTRRAIEERQRLIATMLREADEFAARAAALQAQADGLLDDARRQSAEILRTAAAQASAEASQFERKAIDEAAASVQLAHATIGAERRQAEDRQAPFVEELARAMMQRAVEAGGAA
jgi:F-type H+-transporting ATPase subunit b